MRFAIITAAILLVASGVSAAPVAQEEYCLIDQGPDEKGKAQGLVRADCPTFVGDNKTADGKCRRQESASSKTWIIAPCEIDNGAFDPCLNDSANVWCDKSTTKNPNPLGPGQPNPVDPVQGGTQSRSSTPTIKDPDAVAQRNSKGGLSGEQVGAIVGGTLVGGLGLLGGASWFLCWKFRSCGYKPKATTPLSHADGNSAHGTNAMVSTHNTNVMVKRYADGEESQLFNGRQVVFVKDV